jgi:D-alanyl-D-alanine carboxypeptidase (penicillin-binding protein 5/6)
MSMKDLALLSVHIITTYPDLYPTFSETEYNYKSRSPANANNRNPLLKLNIGADGLKTGHTEEAGYGMVGSVKQGDRRIVFAFNGLLSDKDRAQEAERIANWAFRQFALKTVAKAGTEIAQADVFLGSAAQVGLVSDTDLQLLIPAGAAQGVTADVVYQSPIKAPIAKGTKLADLVIHLPDLPDRRVSLFAANDIGAAGFFDRIVVAFGTLRNRYGI